MKKISCIFCFVFFVHPITSLAALPFVTDDARIANPNQLLIEAFTETWHLPKKGASGSTDMLGQYAGLSYGAAKNLEVTLGGLVGYDTALKKTSYMNPIFQMKTIVLRPNPKRPEIPSVAISAAYVNNNGRGQYYDPAANFYVMGIATSKFFDDGLIAHVNYGPKVSYHISGHKPYKRMHLGVALDSAFMRKDVRFFVEGFNGAPNSPRDSPGIFHSYQAGFKFVKSSTLGFHLLYGKQPTFDGYDKNNGMNYRRTYWIQCGLRKTIDDLF